jgi:toxin ParE1/3/4
VKQKPILLRRRAEDDIDAAIAHYLTEAGAEIAADLIDQLEKVLQNISRQPALGSPRYGHELRIAGLRHWVMKRCPYLIFYVEKERHIEVGRVLHERRDLLSMLDDPD